MERGLKQDVKYIAKFDVILAMQEFESVSLKLAIYKI